MLKQQLGKAFTILAMQQVKEDIMHSDVDIWHAPSECHDLVSKGESWRNRTARRHAKAASGMSRRGFNNAIRANAKILTFMESHGARLYDSCVMTAWRNV